ncbi:MAG: aldehyde dehydrogenase family protein [Chthonomonadales bacterium]
MSNKYSNFIGGEWIAPAKGVYIPNNNPADWDTSLGDFPNSTEEDARAAIGAASDALAGWAGLSAHARGEFLRKTADVLESRLEEVATGLMQEEGKSFAEAKGETARAVVILRYYAAQTMLPDGEIYPSAGAKTFLYSRRVPVGVVSLITPWNFPIAIPVWKAAPALAFGNTVVMKPSELSPLTAIRLAECFEAAGLPKGVFNVLCGQGARTGEVLATDKRVSAISFTGSVKTGKIISGHASAHGKKYQLEMGGKNAAVVLPDADMEQAVNLTIQGAFKSAGEKCTATSRVIVHHDVYAAFACRLKEKTEALSIGPGTDPTAYLGPVISRDAQARILKTVADAKKSGSELLAGGSAPDSPALANGCYIKPTLFGNVSPDSAIASEEVFGPVLCLMKADSLDHAIELTNSVEFGLSASLFSSNLNSAMAFAERVEAGMIRINGETAGVEPQAPFGGMKGSSSWSREQGLAAKDFFTQIKTISVDRAG